MASSQLGDSIEFESTNDVVISKNISVTTSAIFTLNGNIDITYASAKVYLPTSDKIYIGNTTNTLSTNITTGSVPPGVIMMWSGTVATIPTGWSVCDGTTINGFVKPNLKGRFLLCSSATYPAKSNGGATTRTMAVANIPEHSHTVTNTTTTSHSHSIGSREGDLGSAGVLNFANRTGYRSSYTTGGSSDGFQNHTHTYTTLEAGGVATPTPISIMPRYYALIYIIKLPP